MVPAKASRPRSMRDWTRPRGQVIARCDADDLYPPDRLTWQMAWLAQHPEFAAVCGSFATIDRRGRVVASLPCGDAAEEITPELRSGRTRTHLCTYAIRADALRQVGGCRTWFVTAEDIDLQLRLAEAGRIWFEPRPCYSYRLHDASITHQQANPTRTFYGNAARQFQEKRLSSGQDDLQRGCPPAPPVGGG